MRLQRGIADGWLLVIGVLAILVAIGGIIYTLKSWTEGLEDRGYKRGVKETEAAYAERDNNQLKLTLDKVLKLEERARQLEAEHATQLAKIERQREQEARDAEKRRQADVAAVRAGTLKLRIPGATACPAQPGGSTGAEAQGAAAERDGEAGSHLPPEAAEFLLGLANEADDVVRQLAGAQAVIVEQQKTCNGR